MPTTVARRNLPKLSTSGLIAQYDLAISSYAGRLTNTSPRQKRINVIVDMLCDRADAGDAEADQWMKEGQ